MQPPMELQYAAQNVRPLRPRTGVNPFMWVLSAVIWTIAGGASLYLLGFLVAFLFGVPFGYLTPVAALLLLASLATLAGGMRRSRDVAVVYYLEQAVRLNLPLPPMIRAAEQSERRSLRRRLEKLCARLEDGWPVADALADAAPGLPRRVLGLVEAGENTGRLATALRRLVVQRDLIPAGNPVHSIFYRWYPLILFTGSGGILQMLVIFVLPKYEQIMRDYHLTVPTSMRLLVSLSDWFGWAVISVSSFILIVFCGRMLRQVITPGTAAPGPLRAPLDVLCWYLPVLRGISRHRAMADVCHVCADALDAGIGIENAVADAARVRNNVVLDRLLRRWRDRMIAGEPIDQAARSAGMPELMAGMLATARAGDDTPGVFRFLARYYEARFSRSAVLLRGAIAPGIAIGFGALVAVIALGIFQPLVAMMENLCPGMGVR
ncbi:MAG: ral secretion pathway protein [Phycisphaerales bacterium]|nr:ral secretion pathway protein [Phycisphaerales bacterium]